MMLVPFRARLGLTMMSINLHLINPATASADILKEDIHARNAWGVASLQTHRILSGHDRHRKKRGSARDSPDGSSDADRENFARKYRTLYHINPLCLTPPNHAQGTKTTSRGSGKDLSTVTICADTPEAS